MSETVYAGQSTIQASLFQSVSNTANVWTFTSPGQWTKPLFGTSVLIECWGAGGGGAGSAIFTPTSNASGGGGGGGSYVSNTFPINFFPGPAYVFVGAGGAGGPGGGGGSLGDQSNVSLANDNGSAAFIRGWGGNGASAPSPGTSGGGAGLLGPTTFQNTAVTSGNAAGGAVGNSIYSGAPGAGARTVVNVTRNGGAAIFGGGGGGTGNGWPLPAGGTGGTSIYGGGGGPGGALNSVGTTGNARGGGGGGGGIPTTNTGSLAGGAGGRGEVRIFVF